MFSGITRRLDEFARIINRQTDVFCGRFEFLGRELDRIERAIRDIENASPVRVDIDKKLARAIVAKLTDPLVIPQAHADWLAGMAKHGTVHFNAPIGFGNDRGDIAIQVTPNGRLRLTMSDLNGQHFWRGELRGPDNA